MASYQDLFDAIARVRAATGDRDSWQNGLSGADIAAICNPLSSPDVLGAVMTKVIAGHPDAFLAAPGPAAPPRSGEGLAANAIRGAETALAQQHTAVAQLDLQVVTAVLNAHAVRDEGLGELDRLQREIEEAVLARNDLDTPAGAREFQRFLTGKLRDIRTVLDTTGLDATSRAALAAALGSLYGSSTPDSPPPTAEQPDRDPGPSTAPVRRPASAVPISEPALEPELAYSAEEFADPATDHGQLPPIGWAGPPPPVAYQPSTPPAPPPAPAPVAPAPIAALPPMPGGGAPASLGGGLPSLSSPIWPPARSYPDPPPGRPTRDRPADVSDPVSEPAPAEDSALSDTNPESGQVPAGEPTAVDLPDGESVVAPNPELAAVISAALAGKPIPEAFRENGIVLPPPGSPVTAPLEAARLAPGDVGILADRYALALGNGTALLDSRIVPIASVTGSGFLGWLHPPGRSTVDSPTPEVPAPRRPAATAPS